MLGLLAADPTVEGVALVGSLGRGGADDWSDIDLLVLTGDQFIRLFLNDPLAFAWALADLLSDGRHNSPAGAASLGTTHIRSGRRSGSICMSTQPAGHPGQRTAGSRGKTP